MLYVLLLFLLSAQLFAAQINLDTRFGSNNTGIAALSLAPLQSSYNSLCVQPDNKIVAIGAATQANNANQLLVARYLANGLLDDSFGSSGMIVQQIGTTGDEFAGTLQADGKILVTGQMFQQKNFLFIARFLSDGSLDTSFGDNGITSWSLYDEAAGYALCLDANQKILVAGTVILQGQPILSVTRFNSDGSLDSTFATDGYFTLPIDSRSAGRAIIVCADGTLVAGGFIDIHNRQQIVMTRLTAEGQLDTNFGDNGVITTMVPTSQQDILVSIDEQSDNKLIIVANSLINKTQQIITSLRYENTGTLDESYSQNGINILPLDANSYAVDACIVSDKLIIAGSCNTTTMVLQLTDQGVLDATFAQGGICLTTIGASSSLNAISTYSDRIVAGGVSDNQAVALALLPNNDPFIAVTSPEQAALITAAPLTLHGTSSHTQQKVAILLDAIETGSAYTDANGNWSGTFNTLTDGQHTITVELFDEQETTIIASYDCEITVAQSPSITISQPITQETISSTVSSLAKGRATLSNTQVELLIDDASIDTTTTDQFGAWQIAYPPLAVGEKTMTALLKNGSPLSTIAETQIVFVSGTPVLFPPGISQVRMVQAIVPTTGSGSGIGYSYSINGSQMTITFTPSFTSTPLIQTTGVRSSGASNVTISSLDSQSVTLTFSTGTQFVHIVASLLS